ncbi:probable phenylalanine--tRNA ligase, mitochondrial isoform X2 [Halyomorpha halys]|nr:probable phenylalanine--tRNA ligase, mitochondrial isoform X2 [Halyomorpha halys]
MLRAHMTAHQVELIKMGLDNFLMFGDVYRRDEIDSTHYPVFHQCDAVRLFHKEQLFDLIQTEVFERNPSSENKLKQKEHTVVASREIEQQLKVTLEGLARCIFGNDIECRWVDAYFPFTHPSWELEIKRNGNWLEVLGCGIIRQAILQQAGADDLLGWAFGLGLDRLAMIQYSIPDIRTFWMKDPGFLIQFHNKSPQDKVTYKEVSIYPPCKNDISFWINDGFEDNNFYSLVREVGGDLIEQVQLIDKFTHPKTGRKSRCYTIVYRHLEKTLTQAEVNEVHKEIEKTAEKVLGVTIR